MSKMMILPFLDQVRVKVFCHSQLYDPKQFALKSGLQVKVLQFYQYFQLLMTFFLIFFYIIQFHEKISLTGSVTHFLSHTASQWFQMAKTRHNISSFDVVSRVFPSKYQQIYNYFCFRGMSFILKTCRIIAGASMIC